MRRIALLVAAFGLFGCASVNFSMLNPGAKEFHPKAIAVLPATVGEHEAARDVIDVVVSKSLAGRGWFENVVDASTLKAQAESAPDLANDLSTYIQKVNTLGISDSALAGKLHGSLKADALFLTYVTAWGYGRTEGSKVGRVGLGIKLVDASTGTVMWKANHELVEDYWIFKPKLDGMAEELLDLLLKEMPH